MRGSNSRGYEVGLGGNDREVSCCALLESKKSTKTQPHAHTLTQQPDRLQFIVSYRGAHGSVVTQNETRNSTE